MIVIDATDKLEGIASVADVVEFTCSVVDGTTTGSSEGKLSDSQTELWDATAVTRILSLTLVNTHSAAVTVNVQKDPTDAGILYRVMSKDLILGIGYMAIFDGQRFSVYDASGRPLEGYGAHGSDHEYEGSDEISVANLSGLLADDQHVLDAEVLAAAGVNSGVTSMTGLDTDGIPGLAVDLKIPGAIGGTTPAAGAFTTISASGLITATGGQIAFPATAVPSADPNTLDDYEEGTFTFDLLFGGAKVGITYIQNTGTYTKIGNSVVCRGQMYLSNKGSSTGDATVAGFPFTSQNSSGASAAISCSFIYISFADFIHGKIAQNTSTVLFHETTNAGVRTNLTNANFANNSIILIRVEYPI